MERFFLTKGSERTQSYWLNGLRQAAHTENLNANMAFIIMNNRAKISCHKIGAIKFSVRFTMYTNCLTDPSGYCSYHIAIRNGPKI